MKRFLLIGANFQNKGAEAMVITVLRQLSRLYPEGQFVVASYAKKEKFPYSELQIDSQTPKFSLVSNRIKTKLVFLGFLCALIRIPSALKFISRKDPYLNEIFKTDAVIDLSGFALTDQRPLWRRLVYCWEIFLSSAFRKQFVIFTQALGPFNTPSTRLLGKFFLPKTSLILARGQKTLEYLKELGITEKVPTFLCSDVAYLFEPGATKQTEAIVNKLRFRGKPIVGIIPNINLYQRTSGQGQDNLYVKALCSITKSLISECNCSPVFICHELSNKAENDMWLAELVASQFADSEVSIVSSSLQATELKEVLACCELVVASRFHSVVAAISLAVPFLVIGWAHKYKELAKEIDLEDYVLDGRVAEDLERANTLLIRVFNERAATKEHIQEQKVKLVGSAQSAFIHMKEILRS